MAQAAQDDQNSSNISPYLIMAAQKEMASGKPGPAVAQLGQIGLKAGHPAALKGAAMGSQIIDKAGPPMGPDPKPPAMPGVTPIHDNQNGGWIQKMDDETAAPGWRNPASALSMAATPRPPMPVTTAPAVAPTAVNPAGAAGSAQGDPNSVATQYNQDKAAVQTVPGKRAPGVTAENQGKNQETYNLKMPFSAETMNQARDIRGQDPSYQALQAAPERLQALIDARNKQPVPPNLMGLMTAADFLNKTNTFSNSYAKTMPMTQDQRDQQNFTDSEGVEKMRNDAAKEGESQLHDILGGGTMGSLISQMNLQKIADAAHPPQGLKFNQFQTATQREGKAYLESGDVLNNAIQTLSSGNPTMLKAMPTLLARMQEGTVRPQLAVIGQESGDPSWDQKLLNILSTNWDGVKTPEQMAQYAQALRALKATHDQSAGALKARWAISNDHLSDEEKLSPDAFNQFVAPYTPADHPAQAAKLSNMPQPRNMHPVNAGSNAPQGSAFGVPGKFSFTSSDGQKFSGTQAQVQAAKARDPKGTIGTQ